ncbi:hypothetical protein O8B38_22320 [Agrobacterium rhizogenes]|nr:hypothetical protein [Rhizobium rhizogenes]
MKTFEATSIRTGQMWAGLIENGMMVPENREGCHERQFENATIILPVEICSSASQRKPESIFDRFR